MVDYGMKAEQLFRDGYNCAQAVAVAYCDLTGMEEKMAARMASSFGGGMGRMREVCGSVSGMLLVAGILYGYDDPKDSKAKKEHYALVQELAGKFRQETGSIVCRELLAGPAPKDAASTDAVPGERTEAYYKKRPCASLVHLAADILQEYIAEHPLPEK